MAKFKVTFKFQYFSINIVAFVEKSPLLDILWSTISKFILQQRVVDVVSVEKHEIFLGMVTCIKS